MWPKSSAASYSFSGTIHRSSQFVTTSELSFAYPGNEIGGIVVEVLKERGYRFARRGGAPEFPYEGGQGIALEEFLSKPALIGCMIDSRWFVASYGCGATRRRLLRGHCAVASLLFGERS